MMTLLFSKLQNIAFDGTLPKKGSSNSGSAQRSNTSGFGSGSGSESGGSRYTGPLGGVQAPEAHKFKKPAPPPAPGNMATRQQNPPGPGVEYQPDGSYITASHGGHPLETVEQKSDNFQQHAASGDSMGSDQSLGYLRSVQNTQENRI